MVIIKKQIIKYKDKIVLGFSSPVRNTANSIGRWVAGKGTEFQINFKGVNTIIHKTQPTRIYP